MDLLPSEPRLSEVKRLKAAFRFATDFELADFLYKRIQDARAPVTTLCLQKQWNILVSRIAPVYRPRAVGEVGQNQAKMFMKRWRHRWGGLGGPSACKGGHDARDAGDEGRLWGLTGTT